MGTLLDTSLCIDAERRNADLPIPPGDEIAIAAITASELLHGVHRATPFHQARRLAFAEALLRRVLVVPFDLTIARVHARLWAELRAAGITIGYHDMIIAATALSLQWSLATDNVREFSRVPGLVIRDLGGGT